MANANNMFHVSMLQGYLSNPNHVFCTEAIRGLRGFDVCWTSGKDCGLERLSTKEQDNSIGYGYIA